MYGLLDCNNFFVSCQRVFRPELARRPVVVLSNNDGCVIARSNEVKALGIAMGAPYFQIRPLIHRHQIEVFSSNFTLYGDMSHRVMQVLEELCPHVEIYSIDEAFLDLKGMTDLQGFPSEIRQKVRQWTGIPNSIGVAPTKTLAKLANFWAKKNSSYQGVCVLDTPDKIAAVLEKVKVEDIWGIGYRLSQKLYSAGVYTGADLIQVDRAWMRRHFTIVGERTLLELRGISCLPLEEVSAIKKSIQVSRSFSQQIGDYEELREAVASYVTRAAEKLRSSGQKARCLMVYIRTNKFRPQDPQYAQSGIIELPEATDDDRLLIKAATSVLRRIYRSQHRYHKAGVTLIDLCPRQHVQKNLFVHTPLVQEEEKQTALWQAVDHINHRYGKGTVLLGSCGVSLGWRDRKDKTSKSYTTHWDQLVTVS